MYITKKSLAILTLALCVGLIYFVEHMPDMIFNAHYTCSLETKLCPIESSESYTVSKEYRRSVLWDWAMY